MWTMAVGKVDVNHGEDCGIYEKVKYASRQFASENKHQCTNFQDED